MNMHPKIRLWLVVVSLFCLPVAVASDIETKMNDLASTAESIADLKGKIAWTINTTNEYTVELRDLELQLYSSMGEQERLQGVLQSLQGSVAYTAQLIQETSAAQEQMDALARERLRVLYKNSNINYLEVLFEATSYSDFLHRFDLLRRLFESDITLLGELDKLRSQQEALKRQLESDYAEQQRLEQWESWQSQQIEEQRAEKSQLITDILSMKEAYEASERELQARSDLLAEEIRILQEANRSRALGNGTYIWPLAGYYEITSYYGWRSDPFGGSNDGHHNGLDIAAPGGADILAVDGGLVVMASYGYNGGYGNFIMIDHGQGLATLYAHCSALLVEVGESVAQGELIARIGSTGYSTGPHLHIEFRYDGECQEPLDYLW